MESTDDLERTLRSALAELHAELAAIPSDRFAERSKPFIESRIESGSM